jgi:hypothetical protein
MARRYSRCGDIISLSLSRGLHLLLVVSSCESSVLLFAAFSEQTTVYHASELSFIFGPVPDTMETEFAGQMTEYWINFVHDMNPGRMCTLTALWSSDSYQVLFSAHWPQYNTVSRYVMQLMRNNITLIPDSELCSLSSCSDLAIKMDR